MALLFDKDEDPVAKALTAVTSLDRKIYKLKGCNVIVKQNYEQSNFAILSGGGAGHEPFAAGYVGDGSLDCAVSGALFTSPSVNAIYAGLEALITCESKTQILVLVLNYTGDRINFGQAVERAKRAHPNVKIEMYSVADDKSLESSQARGLTGLLVHMKLAAGMFKSGHHLEAVVAELGQCNIGTIGASVSSCSSTSTARVDFGNEMEVGLGIHGEPGVERIDKNEQMPLSDMVAKVRALFDKKMVFPRSHITVITVSNLGGFSELEFLNIVHAVQDKFSDLRCHRFGSGSLMTSLDMRGFNVCIASLTEKQYRWFDAHPRVPAWPHYSKPEKKAEKTLTTLNLKKCSTLFVKNEAQSALVQKVGGHLVGIEERVNELDRISGDGDCGSTFKRLGEHLLANTEVDSTKANLTEFLADAAGEVMGGSSGGLLSIGLRSAIGMPTNNFAPAVKKVADTVAHYGGAKPGQKTLLDILYPISEALSTDQDVKNASATALNLTANMVPLAGRAAYTGRADGSVDPGCFVINEIIKCLDL